MKFVDLAGKKFGRLLIVSFSHRKNSENYWNCVCDCGNLKTARNYSLTGGACKSCGCLSREKSRARQLKHGLSHTKEYVCWSKMKTRCSSEGDDYFKKGIKVCERWINSFENFLADMGTKPTPKHSIDRKNNNGNYDPSNCRWATLKEQANNKSNNRLYTYSGETKTISQWAEIYQINPVVAYRRMKRGIDFYTSMTRPLRITKLSIRRQQAEESKRDIDIGK